MRWLEAAWLTGKCFVEVAGIVGLAWFLVVGPGGEYTWRRLPDPWDQRAAMGLTGLAIAVGLAIYFVDLRRTLLERGVVPPEAAGWTCALLGSVPIVLVVGGFALLLSRMRIGW